MAKLPPLARTVYLGSTGYRAGDTPPLHIAKKITNPKNWVGGKVPNFDTAKDSSDTAEGSSPADARTQSGLPGQATGTSVGEDTPDTDDGPDGDTGGGEPPTDGDTGGTPTPAKKAAAAKKAAPQAR